MTPKHKDGGKVKSTFNCVIYFLLTISSLFSGLTLATTPISNQDASLHQVDILLDQKIMMRDGVSLSATIYQPRSKIKEETTTATIIYLTPYVNDHATTNAWYLAKRGFTFIAVDVRGRGNSEGEFIPYLQEAKDGHDIVEWTAKQSWSNGNVGMLGGSYVGYTQWATVKEFPPHLKTIVPISPVGPGIDSPMDKNIFFPNTLRWLTWVSGLTARNKLFSHGEYWNSIFTKSFDEKLKFSELGKRENLDNPIFSKWISHPTFDEYWQKHHPTDDDYNKINIPILSISGFYDANYRGAINYYKKHMELGNERAKNNHFLLLGPWNHFQTRSPADTTDGLFVGQESVIDMKALYYEWFVWTLGHGEKPELLKDRVAYYTIGKNKWQYSHQFEKVADESKRFYLSAIDGQASNVFSSGSLTENKPTTPQKPHTFISNPSLTPRLYSSDKAYNVDQSEVMAINGNGLVYHSTPFKSDLLLTGEMTLSVWLAMDVPDADFMVNVYEIKPDGTSVYLSSDMMRARYRNSSSHAELVKSGEINQYTFDNFYFYSKVLMKNSRLRLTIAPINNKYYQKNYQSGGVISQETGKDARKAKVSLYSTKNYPSYLELPIKHSY